jgi:hypothetical protein
LPVEDSKENLNICMDYCGTCPSLPFPPQPYLFCARGNSDQTIEKKGCKCPGCPLYITKGLKGMYFCETGKSP